ncbi:MAG: T9SS type A sorting domain-containing protein, partial [Spirochaetes bacterium]|nr:T9SS type A sorting domain-containing protein [Spirochaetota bacterium]
LDASDNGSSVVVLLRYKNFDLWIGGDATDVIENGTMNAVNDTSVTGDGNIKVFRVDHHGSKFHGYAPFLSALDPHLSVISSGGNAYGHPTQDAIDRLEAVNAVNYIYCTEAEGTDGGTPSAGRGVRLGTAGDTELDGDVNLETDGYNIWVNSELKVSGGIEYFFCSPAVLYNNGRHNTTAYVKVNLITNSVSNVHIDLSTIGGVSNRLLYDDGANGDATAGDQIFTLTNIFTVNSAGSYNLNAIVTLTNGTNINKTYSLQVINDRFPPETTSFNVAYSNSGIYFTWKNPVDIDLEKIMIRSFSDTGDYPNTPEEGVLIHQMTGLAGQEGRENTFFSTDFEYYKRYYYTIFFIDSKENYSMLYDDLLTVPLSASDYVFISDNFIKPDKKERYVEFIFHESVIRSDPLKVEIYNISGEIVSELGKEELKDNVILWNLKNKYSVSVGSGLYIALIKTSKGILKKKILVVK